MTKKKEKNRKRKRKQLFERLGETRI